MNAAYSVDSKLIDPDQRFEMPSGIVRSSICAVPASLSSDSCQRSGLVKTDLFIAKYLGNHSYASEQYANYVNVAAIVSKKKKKKKRKRKRKRKQLRRKKRMQRRLKIRMKRNKRKTLLHLFKNHLIRINKQSIHP